MTFRTHHLVSQLSTCTAPIQPHYKFISLFPPKHAISLSLSLSLSHTHTHTSHTKTERKMELSLSGNAIKTFAHYPAWTLISNISSAAKASPKWAHKQISLDFSYERKKKKEKKKKVSHSTWEERLIILWLRCSCTNTLEIENQNVEIRFYQVTFFLEDRNEKLKN